MFHFSIICYLFLAVLSAAGTPDTSNTLSSQSIPQLEERLLQIDRELENLAHLSLRNGTGSIGFRSFSYVAPDNREWVEVDLEEAQWIDEIVLVPVLWRDSKTEFKADGLPDQLFVWAGETGDKTGKLIATVNTDLPRIAPLVIPIPRTKAAWVRVETDQLNRRDVDQRYIFHLAEILLFNGEENVALHQSVTVSTQRGWLSDAWNSRFLVDGHLPYLMDTGRGNETRAFIRLGALPPMITIDLQEPTELSRIHLHAVDQSELVPQAHFSDYGMPRHLRIEGALQADFSDVQVLLETHRESAFEAGPIMMWRIQKTDCRYVRIIAPTAEANLHLLPTHLQSLSQEIDPKIRPADGNAPLFRVGYAEVELFSAGTNIALGKAATSTNLPTHIQGELPALTDGSNLYGEILPLRAWLNQLARRHEREKERPLIEAELTRRYASQHINLTRMYWTSGLLAVCIFGALITARGIHLYQMKKIKHRIAADLHDELGANLHAIGLLGDLSKMEVLKNEKSDPAKLIQYLDEVRMLTESSGSSTRYFSRMLDAENYHENLIQEMKHTAQRYLVDLHHEGSFPPDQALQHLSSKVRIDLYLFYKECLTNIIRHSDASEVHTSLQLIRNQLRLTVTDNGVGLNGPIPPSLKRRAQFMRAKITTESPAGSGTTVTLNVRIKKMNRAKASQ